MRVAILSPTQDAPSETFIRGHREHLAGERSYYYGGYLPGFAEGEGELSGSNTPRKGLRLIRGRATQRGLGFHEYCLYRSLKARGVDVLLAEYGPTGAACTDVAKALGVPLVVHFHGYDASKRSVLAEHREGYRRCFAYASKIVVVSEAMHRALQDLGAPPDKLVLNPYGPAPQYLAIDRRPASTPQLLAAGRLVDKKAPHLLLLAMAKVPIAQLTLGGDGPLRQVCRDLRTQLGLEERVTLPGWLDGSQIRAALSTARIFVQHSVVADDGDSEGTPLSILEASAAGVPVVSTRHAGIPDVVLEGETGLLVDEGDVGAMAASIQALLDDPDRAEAMGAAGRERIREHFSFERYIRTLDDILAEAAHAL